MTLLEFIKSKFFDRSELGYVAKNLVNDPKFPDGKSEREILRYLDQKTKLAGTNPTFKSFLMEFKRKTNNLYNEDLYHVQKYVVL